MKENGKLEFLKTEKDVATALYEIYMAQSEEKDLEVNCYHENEHDNSGCHPDYHNNSHDNTPGRMKIRSLIKNNAAN